MAQTLENLISKEILMNFIINELSLDQDLFLKQLGYFSKHLSEFKESGNDPSALSRLAHKIKVGCRCFGAEKFEAKMEQIELLHKNNTLQSDSEIFRSASENIDPLLIAITKISEEIFRKG